MHSRAILLVNTGTPNAPTVEAIRPYLRLLLSDKRIVSLPSLLWQPILHCLILPGRPFKTAHSYQRVWTPQGSPYTLFSSALERKLKRFIRDEHAAASGAQQEPPLVRMTHRYSKPMMRDALELFCDHGVRQLTVLPLYPQQCFATTESVRDELFRQLELLDYQPKLRFINNYHDHPAYIDALAQTIGAAINANADPQTTRLVFSYHSTPVKHRNNGDLYFAQTQETSKLVAQAAGLADDLWQIAYQSRFEDSQKWLQPTLTTSLKRLVHSGVQNIYVIAPGFAVDNIETLDEIEYCANKYVCDLSRQRSNRGYSGGSGGSGDNDQATLTYIPALNDSDEHVRALAAILGA